MKKFFNFKNIYILLIACFTFKYINYIKKPDIKKLTLVKNNDYQLVLNSPQYLKTLISPDNRINVGKSFLFLYDKNFYRVNKLSFWRKEYVNLDFLHDKLGIKNLEIRKLKNNNYAIGIFENKEIAYSCIRDSNSFFYDISFEEIPKANNLKNWVKVMIKNINYVFYAFKPSNYECLLVITPNLKFFEYSEKEINKIIFSKFIYE